MGSLNAQHAYGQLQALTVLGLAQMELGNALSVQQTREIMGQIVLVAEVDALEGRVQSALVVVQAVVIIGEIEVDFTAQQLLVPSGVPAAISPFQTEQQHLAAQVG